MGWLHQRFCGVEWPSPEGGSMRWWRRSIRAGGQFPQEWRRMSGTMRHCHLKRQSNCWLIVSGFFFYSIWIEWNTYKVAPGRNPILLADVGITMSRKESPHPIILYTAILTHFHNASFLLSQALRNIWVMCKPQAHLMVEYLKAHVESNDAPSEGAWKESKQKHCPCMILTI